MTMPSLPVPGSTNWYAWAQSAHAAAEAVTTGRLTDEALRAALGLVINVKAGPYNAKGDGSTNDSAAIQAAYNAARDAGGGVVFFPVGTYIAGDLVTYSNTKTLGSGASASIIKNPNTTTYGLSVNPGSGGTSSVTDNVHDVVVMNIGFRGSVDVDGFAEHNHLLNVNAVTRAHVVRCNFIGFRGDGIYVGSSNIGGIERHNQAVRITDCFFDGVNKDNRNGISVIDGDDVLIQGNRFTRMTRSTMPGAVDIEPDRFTFPIVRNIKILNNDFTDIDGVACVSVSLTPDQGSLTVPAQNVYIEGNTFRAPNAMGVYAYSETPAPSDSTAPHNIFIRRNTSLASNYPYEISGLRGVYISNNVWGGASENSRLGQWYPVHDVTIADDTYNQVADAATGTVHRIYQVSRLTIVGNKYINCGKADGTGGSIALLLSSGGYVSGGFEFSRNRVTGARTTTLMTLQGGATVTPAENYAVENRIGTLTVPTSIFGNDSRQIPETPQTGTAYTLGLTDAGRAVAMNNAAANTVTIPPNSSAAFPVGTVIEIFQLGAGQTTVAAGAGVTLRAPDGAKLGKQYASASLRKRATDEWVLAGNTTA